MIPLVKRCILVSSVIAMFSFIIFHLSGGIVFPNNKMVSSAISLASGIRSVQRLASLPDWTVVVVADTKTPKDWHWPGVHFLSVDKQLSLGLKLPRTLPFKTYTRKNVGYLYAIMNGAKWIYDTDDDNKPYGLGLEQFDYGETVSGLRYTPRQNISEKLFNPYRFYGYKDMWPRGFPLEFISDHSNGEDRLILCREMKTAAVQQGIVHKDPDVDAIFRLLHTDKKGGLDVSFNKYAPSVLLEAETYSPWNSQNTLFHRTAFFTMFLPTTVEFRAVYTKSGQIVEFLDGFECGSQTTQDCFMELAEGFANRSFIQKQEIDLISDWISDLTKIGYMFPPLARANNMKVNLTEFRGNCRGANLELAVEKETLAAKVSSRARQKVEYFNEIRSWCNETEIPNVPSSVFVDSLHSSMPSIEDKKNTVAVFINNYPWSRSIGLLQRMYSPYFATTIFCGPWNPEAFIEDDLSIIKPINYVNLTEEEGKKGFLFYYCVSKVRDMRLQHVKGYFFIADDAVFNIWHPLPTDVVLTSSKRHASMNDNWWNVNSIGKDAAKEFVHLMEYKYAKDERVQNIWKRYDEGVRANGYQSAKEAMLNWTGRIRTDLFYVPTTAIELYADMCEYLTEAGMFVEIAANKLLLPFNSTVFPMESFWYRTYNTPDKQLEFYNATHIGIHPIKLSFTQSDQSTRNLFCSRVVSAFQENLFQS